MMADTPERQTLFERQQAWIDEITEMPLRETPRETADYTAFETRLARVQTKLQSLPASDEEVIDLDAVNDAEVTRQLDKAEVFEHEFTHSVGVIGLLDRDTQQVDEQTVAWPSMSVFGQSDLKSVDEELAEFIYQAPLPQATTFVPDTESLEAPVKARKGFLNRFKRQKSDDTPTPEFVEHVPRRRVGRAIGAVAVATGLVAAGVFGAVSKFTSNDSPDTIAATARTELQYTAPALDTREELGALLTVGRQVTVRPIDFETTQEQARAIITVADMDVKYGSENVQALFDNLSE